MKQKILKVTDLNIELDGCKIIENLSFEVSEREVLVVLGPNGAGKSTLLKALIGLLPYQGNILWNTKNISYLPPQEFFQRQNIPPLSIEEFFKFKKVSSKEIRTILRSVELDPSLFKRQFGHLSTGQFQRMMIAWALVDKPSVLLFDEPTSGIDLKGQKTIYSLLHKFWEKNILTVILVTHDLNIVWEHANNVLCLNKRSICYGKPRKVLTPEGLEKLYGTGIKFYEHKHD